MEYGLIGGALGHSYSKLIHEKLADYTYELHPLPTEAEARRFLEERAFRAINVTIPYKQLVMEYCGEIDPAARAIGAVNTVVNDGGVLRGWNTDYAGFLYMADRAGADFQGKTVLVLGTGGTQRTVCAAAKDRGAARVLTVSRRKTPDTLTYDEAARTDAHIVVNTTPAGMYPHNGECLLNLSGFEHLEAVLDVVYNPFETRLLFEARRLGVRTGGGLPMLVAQAKYAAEYFTGRAIGDAVIPDIASDIFADRANLVLVGMPSSGKSSVGKGCAKLLGKRFVDLDEEIERRSGRRIPDIFAEDGEAAFRALERAVCADVTKESGLVVATGGGAVLDGENVRCMRQNGVVVWLKRPLEALDVGGYRPLSKSTEALREMEARRTPLYSAAAHAVVENTGTFEQTVESVKEAFYEISRRQWA